MLAVGRSPVRSRLIRKRLAVEDMQLFANEELKGWRRSEAGAFDRGDDPEREELVRLTERAIRDLGIRSLSCALSCAVRSCVGRLLGPPRWPGCSRRRWSGY